LNKICSKCKNTKPLSEFYNCNRRTDGKQTYCIPCKKEYVRARQGTLEYINQRKAERLKYKDSIKKYNDSKVEHRRNYCMKKNYGIDVAFYNSLLEKQQNVCSICKRPERVKRSGNSFLSIDHCHKSGKIRGLLCQNCNSAIGKLEDNVEFLKSAIDYLESSK
jgi:hypothetical protein